MTSRVLSGSYTGMQGPLHYTWHPSGVESITLSERCPFNLGCALALLYRCEHKGQKRKDLLKATWHLRRADLLEESFPPSLELMWNLAKVAVAMPEHPLSMVVNMMLNRKSFTMALRWLDQEIQTLGGEPVQ